MLTAGALQVFAIFDKPDPLDGPFFEETIYVTPSSLDASPKCAIAAAIARAVDAARPARTGLSMPSAVSVRTASFVLEIAARPIGGLCSRALAILAPDGARRSKKCCCVTRSARTSADVTRERAARP